MAGCEHSCENTVGGYNCTCESGHALTTDLHNCLGKLVVSLAFRGQSSSKRQHKWFYGMVYPGNKRN